MKSKPWMELAQNTAKCHRCGAISQWVFGYRMSSNGKVLGYWKWWQKFKQYHVACLEQPNENS